MSFLLSWLVLALAVWATAALMPSVQLRDFPSAVITAAVFGLLNFFLGWLFMVVFGIVTLGIAWLLSFVTRWLIDAILLKLTDSLFEGFHIETFGSALLAALLMSGFGTLGQWLLASLGVV